MKDALPGVKNSSPSWPPVSLAVMPLPLLVGRTSDSYLNRGPGKRPFRFRTDRRCGASCLAYAGGAPPVSVREATRMRRAVRWTTAAVELGLSPPSAIQARGVAAPSTVCFVLDDGVSGRSECHHRGDGWDGPAARNAAGRPTP
ncbi:hypothetical protein GCM10010276_36980 [Streptomyces longisporus]|uniref:Uncharacterized protein n=1 Tax=Streptomyces longisporus TaxID=1948 RepID=A0ABN3M131_STRLO